MKKIILKALIISLLIIPTTVVYATINDAGHADISANPTWRVLNSITSKGTILNVHWKNFKNNIRAMDSQQKEAEEANEIVDIILTIDGKKFYAKLYNNKSAEAIVSQMPFSLDMSDFSNQEKVAPLTFELPSVSAEIPSAIRAGEIYLWSGNQMVLFYTSFSSNSYSYVPIGYIDDVSELKKALGSGNSTIKFSVL